MKGQVRWQSLQFYRFVNNQPCAAGHRKRGQAHHYITRGSVEGSDAKLIPLCPRCHDSIHHGYKSHDEFYRLNKIKPERVWRELHEAFIREHNLVWDQTKYPTFEELLSANDLATRYQESKKVNRRYDWQDSPKRFIPIDQREELQP